MKKIFISFILIQLASFASKSAVFNVMDFGARNNGAELTTLQIQSKAGAGFTEILYERFLEFGKVRVYSASRGFNPGLVRI